MQLAATLDAGAALTSCGSKQAKNFRAESRNLGAAKRALDPSIVAFYPSLFPSAGKLAAGLCTSVEANETVISDIARHVKAGVGGITSNAMHEYHHMSALEYYPNLQQQQLGEQQQFQQQSQMSKAEHKFAIMKAQYALSILRAVTEQEEQEDREDVTSRLAYHVLPELIAALESLSWELNLSNNKLWFAPRQRNIPTDESSVAKEGDIAHILCESIELGSRVVLHARDEMRNSFVKRLLDVLNDTMCAVSGPVVAKIRSIACRWAHEFAESKEQMSYEGQEATQSDPSKPSTANATLDAENLVKIFSPLLRLHRYGYGDCNKPESEKLVLDALLRLCELQSDDGIGQKMFEIVERRHLIGLRAKNSEQQSRFFKLYDSAIGKTPVERLKYIVTEQSWDALSDRFWLKYALDLFFAVLVQDEPLHLHINAAQVVHLPSISSEQEDISKDRGMTQEADQLTQLIEQQQQFAQKWKNLKVRELINQLKAVAADDANAASHLWIAMFPVVWSSLQRYEQSALAKPMMYLLSKEHHSRQAPLRPNVMCTLLEGMSVCDPQPRVPADIVKYIGKTFNASLVAIPVLESHVPVNVDQHLAQRSHQQRNNLYCWLLRCLDALQEMYRYLSADDCVAGLWWCQGTSPGIKTGLTYSIHGFHARAEEVYVTELGKRSSSVSKLEQCVCEQELIKAAKNLEHWDVLSDFANRASHADLNLEASFKLGNLSGALKAVNDSDQVLEDSPNVFSMRAALLLRENKVFEADKFYYRGMMLALEHWWKLPQVVTDAHEHMMHSFQQLVEVNEAAKSMNQLEKGQVDTALQTLEAWNSRLPNLWEPFTWWSSIESLRSHLREAIADRAQAQMNAQQNALQHLQNVQQQTREQQTQQQAINQRLQQLQRLVSFAKTDKSSRSSQRLAAIARKQGEAEMALRLLEQREDQQPPQQVNQSHYHRQTHQDSIRFMRLTEQVKALLAKSNEGTGEDPGAALSQLEMQNLEQYPESYKAELFRLRAEALHCAGDLDGASQAYVTSVALYRALPQAWMGWGEHADYRGNMYDSPTSGAMVPSSGMSKWQWYEYAVTCYLQAARYDAQHYRAQLARVLELLLYQDQFALIAQAVGHQHEYVPAWAWLYHAPHLQMALRRPHGLIALQILERISLHFPQAVYFQIRTAALDYQNSMRRTYPQNHQQQQQQQQHEGTNQGEEEYTQQQRNQPDSASVASNHVSAGTAQQNADEGLAQQNPSAYAQAAPAASSDGKAQEQNQGSAWAGPAAPTAAAAAAAGVSTSGPDGGADYDGSVRLSGDPEHGHPMPSTNEIFDKLKKIIERMRKQHLVAMNECEAAIPEITGTRFTTGFDEKMFVLLQALVYKGLKHDLRMTEGVPNALLSELRAVCKSYFSEEPMKRTSVQHSYMYQNADKIQTELHPDSNEFPKTLEELLHVLKRWVVAFGEHLNAKSERFYLDEESTRLSNFRPSEFAIPGQLLDDREPPPGVPVRMVALYPEVIAVRKGVQCSRRLGMLGEDGRMRYFIVMSLTLPGRAEDRLTHYNRYLNGLLERSSDARKRHLQLHTPASIHVWPSVCMMEEPENMATYAEAIEVFAAKQGREADGAMLYFKRRVDELSSHEEAQPRRRALDELISPQRQGEHAPAQQNQTQVPQGGEQSDQQQQQQQHTSSSHNSFPYVPDWIFTQHIYRTLPTASHVWALKWQLCRQIALFGLVGHLMQIQARAPNKLMLSKSTGQVNMLDFHPQFDPQGMPETRNVHVWFRLTRNLSTFFTAFGIASTLAASVRASASSLLETHTSSGAHTTLMYHDELLIILQQLRRHALHSPQMRVMPLPPLLAPESPPPEEMRKLAQARSEELLDRAKELAPPPQSPNSATVGSNYAQHQSTSTPGIGVNDSVMSGEGVSQGAGSRDAHEGARRHIEASCDLNRLCQMDPTWQPWY